MSFAEARTMPTHKMMLQFNRSNWKFIQLRQKCMMDMCVQCAHIRIRKTMCVGEWVVCVCALCTTLNLTLSIYLSYSLFQSASPKNVLCLNVNYAVLILFSTTSCFSVQFASKQESIFNIHICSMRTIFSEYNTTYKWNILKLSV